MGNQRNRSNRGGAKRGAERVEEVQDRNEAARAERESISTNQPSSINFASEFGDEEVQIPGGDAPDPNNYEGHEDDGFVKNIVAGGGLPDSGAFTPAYVNGVDHEEVDEDAPETDHLGNPVVDEAEVSEPVVDAPTAPVEDGKQSG